MATVELDPQFIKALRLLRSKSKESGPQLRAMLEEAIRFEGDNVITYLVWFYSGKKRVSVQEIPGLPVSESNNTVSGGNVVMYKLYLIFSCFRPICVE